MWDWYEPYEIRCPDCNQIFRRWQGKDGPSSLFVWRQDARHPVDHDVDEEFRIDPSRWDEFQLPGLFLIEATDDGHHAAATGECVDGVWRHTYLHHGSYFGCGG